MSRNSRNQQNNGEGTFQYHHSAVDKSHPYPHVEVPPALCSGPSLPAAAASPRMDAERVPEVTVRFPPSAGTSASLSANIFTVEKHSWTVGLQLWTWMIIVLHDEITRLSEKSNTKARLTWLTGTSVNTPPWTRDKIICGKTLFCNHAANPMTLKSTQSTHRTHPVTRELCTMHRLLHLNC